MNTRKKTRITDPACTGFRFSPPCSPSRPPGAVCPVRTLRDTRLSTIHHSTKRSRSVLRLVSYMRTTVTPLQRLFQRTCVISYLVFILLELSGIHIIYLYLCSSRIYLLLITLFKVIVLFPPNNLI